MVTNVPVRLVRKDGELIPLNVTTLTLDVDRSINPHSIPFAGGKRFAFDLNMAKAVILLEGIITDDDLSAETTDIGSSARATIEWGRINTGQNTTQTVVGDGNGTDLTSLGISMTNDSFDTPLNSPVLSLKDLTGTVHEIFFIKSTTVQGYDLGSSGKYHVAIHDNSARLSAVDIAANLVALINSSANSNALSSKFTAAVAESSITGLNTVVTIDLDGKGSSCNGVSPSWTGHMKYIPKTTFFTGGRNTSSAFTSMSAGDKVMSLYGTLNNSNDGGTTAISKGARKEHIGGIFVTKSAKDLKYGDYIIGIQIPFNSTIDNDGGDKYVAKNFFMPTGNMENTVTKHPNQAQIASLHPTDTNDSNDTRFIKGSVTKATFVQLGGEPIYQFNIQFVPVDYLI
tara:strand:- start:1334 stop:2530 length:1197 start_codon:yes stop_codon:yes gene_type:complete